MMDTETLCKHPFDVLLRDEGGYWNCMCGATGSLGWSNDGKLKFIIPDGRRPTRQQKRKWLRGLVKDREKRLKKQARMTT